MDIFEHLANIMTAIIMITLSISSRDNKMMLLIAFGAFASILIWELITDIAAYYALNAVVAVLLSWYAAFKCKGMISDYYSFLMLINSMLCLLLIFDFTPQINTILQNFLELYGNMTYPLIIFIGIAASDNVFTRLYRSYAFGFSGRDFGDRGNNKDMQDKGF